MHRQLILCVMLGLVANLAQAAVTLCPVTSGTLSLICSTPRATGISPLTVFFDCTGTTDSATLPGANNTFQDVTYTWNFSDPNASGKGNWAYGSKSAYTSKNIATGAVAAHLYITSGTTLNTTAIVTATDGTNTATCGIALTAYDPTTSNGFPGTATTCVYNSSLGTGCPSGAATLSTSSIATAIPGALSGKQILFKCGDTFGPNNNVAVSGVKWSIGAYGGCQGTQSNRPIFSDTASTNEGTLQLALISTGDGRIADIDCEGGSGRTGSNGCVNSTQENPPVHIAYQITESNLLVNNYLSNFGCNQCAQTGLFVTIGNGANTNYISAYLNAGGNNPGTWSGNAFNNLDYQAVIGSHFTGVGCCGTGGGVETFRNGAGTHEVFENNTFQDSNDVGAVLKIHNGNTNGSLPTPWSGVYTQYVEISDNLFTGNSGANLVENAPENANDDERLRYFVVERNAFVTIVNNTNQGRLLLTSGQNMTDRDNVMFYASGNTNASYFINVAQRSAFTAFPTLNIEVYNNTCYSQTSVGGQSCVNFTSLNFDGAPPTNSWGENTLYYAVGSAQTAVLNGGGGTGITIINNTATSTNNPSFVNTSGLLTYIYDFKPTANYSGGTCLANVLYDALGIPFSPACDWGAVHH